MNKMTKSVVASAIIAAGFAMAAPASAEQYINAQLAISDVGSYGTTYGFDNGLTLVGTYGITIPSVHQYFGVEGEISKSIVDPEYDFGSSHAEYDYYTAGGYAVFAIPVHEKINIRARGGLVYNHYKITSNTCTFFGCGSYSDSDINPSIGAGATYNFNSNLNFMAEVTAIDIDEDVFHVSAGAQFKF